MGLLLGFPALFALIFLIYTAVAGAAPIWSMVLLTFALLLGLPAGLFAYLGLREPPPIKIDKTLERRVLQLAAKNDGELTASQLALSSQLPIQDCQEVLERYEMMGVAHAQVGDQGELRYVFPELQESIAEDDDFMRRLEQEDPRSVLDFDFSEVDDIEEPREQHVTEPARRDEN